MLGIEGVWVFLAYLGCLLSAVLCVVYGLTRWNRPAGAEKREIAEEARWEKEESKISGDL